MEITPMIGVPYSKSVPYMDLRQKVAAACNTIGQLQDYGLELGEPTPTDQEVAATLVHAYANNPEKTSKTVTNSKLTTTRPEALVLADTLLRDFGQAVVESAGHIRHLVTNKLILETDNPDARIRLKALELLGKLSDVGLFTEKSEITITHKSTDELKEQLRSKLTRLIDPNEPIEDANIVAVNGEYIDLGEELGVDDS